MTLLSAVFIHWVPSNHSLAHRGVSFEMFERVTCFSNEILKCTLNKYSYNMFVQLAYQPSTLISHNEFPSDWLMSLRLIQENLLQDGRKKKGNKNFFQSVKIVWFLKLYWTLITSPTCKVAGSPMFQTNKGGLYHHFNFILSNNRWKRCHPAEGWNKNNII